MMRSEFTKGILVVTVLTLIAITMVGGIQWAKSSLASSGGQERKKRNVKDEVLTPIDAAPDEVDASKREARKEKNRRFNKSKRAFQLEEQKDGEISGTLLESPPPPALPITSDLIIVGRIQRRQPYLSENITCIYSELTVQVEDILKNNPSSPIDAYKPLTVNREGGAIRIPDGRVLRYFVSGSGSIPEVGKRYVLFLKHNTDRDYKLVCGYELIDNVIIPLEDFADRASLADLTEAQFLDLLKQKIFQSQAEKEVLK
jgi:hypothetical protein